MKNRAAVLPAALALSLAVILFSPLVSLAAGPGWSLEEGNWYYYDGEGQRSTGWIQVEGKYYYLYEDGHCAMNERTPDGYLVDENGVWYEPETRVLEKTLKDAAAFVSPSQAGDGWGGLKADYEKLAEGVKDTFGAGRILQIGESSLEYRDVSTGEILLGFYRCPPGSAGDFYRLDVRALFARENTEGMEAAYYNYEILRGMLCKVTPGAGELSSAILSSWQETNAYGIGRGAWTALGGCRVRYEAGTGCGRFWIAAP